MKLMKMPLVGNMFVRAIIEEIIYWQLDKSRLTNNGHDKEAEQNC